MKTNYNLLIFTFIINVFSLLSLNSFSTSTMYLPVLFIYFASNIASFIDKYLYYKETNLLIEKNISLSCLFVSIAIICLYLSDTLGFVKITFQNVCGKYYILLQGVSSTFFSFNSINITLPIFIAAASIPFAYLCFCICAYLRDSGFTRETIKTLVVGKKKLLILFFLSAIGCASCGMQVCYYKYKKSFRGFGEPQYLKYFFAFGLIYILLFSYIFINRYKNKK